MNFGSASTSGGSSLFGQPTSGSTGGLFGNVGASGQTTSTSSPSLFGSTPATTATSNLFGAQKPAASGGTFSFTNPGQTSGQQSNSPIFGPGTATPNKPADSATQAQKPSGLFGNTTTGSPNIFGSTTPATAKSGLFGNISTTPAGPPPQAQTNTSFGQQNTAPSALFGNARTSSPLSTNSPAVSTPTLGSGSGADQQQQAKPASNLFGATGSTPNTSNTTSGGLFSNLGQTKPVTDASKPSANTGLFGSGGAIPTTSQASGSLFTPSSGTSTQPAFSLTPATTTKPSTSLATATTAGSNTQNSLFSLGTPASTATPATTTAAPSDLTKYQKEFQEQAEQVAEWDRMLVENSTKVQKLYGNTVDAERATQEVERQLASVESQQDELSSWLDRYEQEVETLLSKQVGTGDNLPGPDQERARTYKLAERLSERLNEMGQDLTSMIEEVNTASATLSKTSKADEPISQIVRILNSHLSQLQLIDQGTAALRAKITASQKLGNSINGFKTGASRGVGGGSGGAAEDFYRSYMGRR
ncbi:nucleoporin nsp1 [Microsporum canis CBS 113480]|uniref:Nucleoporin NSP1 n=1 Tax=Arthroderma otae (strain ATCC MYA-4605 / CBS 113480) TaxID=554155 RepID=C5FSG5_ARTOC|nr:nucleoporin nsp1 [Microsporum canis CBS 113480]EEQ32818.1 nucleoporin nsp1 [Microsporum canis CBS 113480]